MGFVLSLFFGFVPMLLFTVFVYWLDRFEKEPKALIRRSFFWGALIAAGGAFLINTSLGMGIFAITGSETLAEFSTGSFIAPLVEETLKALSVIIVFLFNHNEFNLILDGIIYAAVTALGFAATENTYYIYTYGFQDGGFSGLFSMVFVRVILVGWQHPFFTSFFGIGLAAARMERRKGLAVVYALGGFGMAVFTHSFHNTLSELLPDQNGMWIGSIIDWTGWIIMFFFILFMINREKNMLKKFLAEEVGLGVLNEKQFLTSYSGFNRFAVFLSTFHTPQYRDTRLFYQLCGELAHKKNQFIRMGDEKGNANTIADLRTRLASLSPVIRS